MANEERLLTVPLRAEWLKKPRIHRTQRSIIEIKSYFFKHMKATDVKMSELLNESLWKQGAKGSTNKVKVKASKDEKGLVTVMLPEEKLVVEEKKGVAARILRRKGKIVKRIVLDKPKAEPAKTGQAKTEASKTDVPKSDEAKPAEHKHEHKPGEEHKHTAQETSKPELKKEEKK